MYTHKYCYTSYVSPNTKLGCSRKAEQEVTTCFHILLPDTTDTSAVSHSRHVCCATQQTRLLGHRADDICCVVTRAMSAEPSSGQPGCHRPHAVRSGWPQGQQSETDISRSAKETNYSYRTAAKNAHHFVSFFVARM